MVPEAAALCARAFHDNAAYCSLFPWLAPEEVARAMEWLFVRRLQIFMAIGAHVFVATSAEGRVVGCVTLVPPDASAGLGVQISHGLLKWPFLWGASSFWSVLTIDSRLGTRPEGAWQVNMMAVEPTLQGQGIGTRLMRELLAVVRAEVAAATAKAAAAGAASAGSTAAAAASAPEPPLLYLDTQRAINVPFYAKLGFREVVEARREVPPYGDRPAFTSWTMTMPILPA